MKLGCGKIGSNSGQQLSFLLFQHRSILSRKSFSGITEVSQNMSVSRTSTTLLRRALLDSRFSPQSATIQSQGIRPALGSYNSIHNSARLPAITASGTRRRPTLRPHQRPAAQARVNGPLPVTRRTIFIQTENTPNPDVS